MKVLILNPPFLGRFSRAQRSPAVTKSGTLYYPVWLCYAAGVLEKEGFEVKLIDAPACGLQSEDIFKIAADFSPELVVVDTSTPSIYNDVRIAATIKEKFPGTFIILVGTHVSALPQQSLKISKNIDAVAIGEYDYTIRDLAIALRNKNGVDKVSGISLRKEEVIINNPLRPKIMDLDAIPFVSEVYKKHLNIKDYFFAASNYPEVQIFTARGCPFRCFFCVYPQVMHGHFYRARGAQSVAAEFRFISENIPQVREVVIEDDTFTIDKDRVQKFCDILIKEKNKLAWNANVRADLDLDTMKKMKQARCRLIIVGVETADQLILNNIHKGIKLGQIYDFFKNARKAKLLVHAAFMAGNPGENKITLKKTLRLAKKWLPDTAQFFPLMVYPGTEAFNWAKEQKLLISTNYRDWVTPEGLHNCVIKLPGITPEELVRFCDKSRRAYYLNPRYIFYKLKMILFNPQEARRAIKALFKFWKYVVRGTFPGR